MLLVNSFMELLPGVNSTESKLINNLFIQLCIRKIQFVLILNTVYKCIITIAISFHFLQLFAKYHFTVSLVPTFINNSCFSRHWNSCDLAIHHQHTPRDLDPLPRHCRGSGRGGRLSLTTCRRGNCLSGGSGGHDTYSLWSLRGLHHKLVSWGQG